jgi:hypothetical protein
VSIIVVEVEDRVIDVRVLDHRMVVALAVLIEFLEIKLISIAMNKAKIV